MSEDESENTDMCLVIFNRRTKYFVARQQYKVNVLSHLHGSTEHFCIADVYIYANNNKEGMYSAFPRQE
jgi:hypothetical protein